VIWKIANGLRVDLRLPSLPLRWAALGLDPRVAHAPLARFLSRYELISDPSRYLVVRTGGIQPENRLLPMTFDELDRELTDGFDVDPDGT